MCVSVCVQVSVRRVTILMMASSPACLALWDPTNQKSGVHLVFSVGETWSPSTPLLCPSSSVRPKVRIFSSFGSKGSDKKNYAALFCPRTHIASFCNPGLTVFGSHSPVLPRTLLQHKHTSLYPLSHGNVPSGVWTKLLHSLPRKHHYRL